ncbi:leucyl aminopeptidase [Orrella sp. 11846]|uniref:leucyl aminopeptidase n=1 Tax=Orrella sp. 11846 TaxID=3409913 RepID=UPI003B5B95CB
MEFSTRLDTSLHQTKTEALAVGVFEASKLTLEAQNIDRASDGQLTKVLGEEFTGSAGQTLVLRELPGVHARRVVLVGLGKEDEFDDKAFYKAELAFAKLCAQMKVKDACSALLSICEDANKLEDRARLSAQAVHDATYRYTETFGKPDPKKDVLLKKFTVTCARSNQANVKAGLAQGDAIGQGMNFTKTLGNLPGNICTPTYLANQAKDLAKAFKSLKVTVLDQKQIEALGMGSFLSVARGSEEPPKFIVLHYRGKGESSRKKTAPVVLVGKGITFDTGGISLKPAATMDEMKYDMCGAASVLGTIKALCEMAWEGEMVGLIPTCENMPSGRANKPGDIVTSMSGQTIEVLNTDAEGRLILCDALTYAEKFKPDAVIDIATLTGACVVALGSVNTGLFSPNDALADELLAASRKALDPAWRMPVEDDYQEQLKSNFADIANIGGPKAGAVTAACFLARFTKAYDWAHLDIAGTAWNGGQNKGATGRPVPLLVQFLLARAAGQND